MHMYRSSLQHANEVISPLTCRIWELWHADECSCMHACNSVHLCSHMQHAAMQLMQQVAYVKEACTLLGGMLAYMTASAERSGEIFAGVKTGWSRRT